jgi:hypothetical protein
MPQDESHLPPTTLACLALPYPVGDSVEIASDSMWAFIANVLRASQNRGANYREKGGSELAERFGVLLGEPIRRSSCELLDSAITETSVNAGKGQ